MELGRLMGMAEFKTYQTVLQRQYQADSEAVLRAPDWGEYRYAIGKLESLERAVSLPELITLKMEELLAARTGEPERRARAESERTAHRVNTRWHRVGATGAPSVGRPPE